MPIVSVGQITIVDVNDGVDGLDGPALQIISSAAGFTYQDGVASPADQVISFTLLRQGLDNTEANWAASGATLETNKDRVDITEYVFGLPGAGDGDTAYLTLAQFGTARQMSIGATVGSLAAYANVLRIGDSTAEAGATRNVLSGSWATATAYGVGDIVVSSGFRWICTLAHISSGSVMPPVFPATANTYWRLEGARGALTTSRAIAGSSWLDAEAATAIADAGGVSPVQGDVVTLFNTTAGYSETRIRSSAGPWTALSVIFGGNVIVDNTLTASKIQANAITTDKLAANTITASKLLVADFSNMVQDPMMVDNSSWVSSGGTAWTTWGTSATENPTFRSTRFMKITGASGSYAGFHYSKWMPVEPGQSYYITAQGRSVGGIASGAQTNLEWAEDENRTGYVETDFTSTGSDTPVDVVRTVTAPAGKRFLRVRFYKNNNTVTEVRWGGLIVRRRASGELIVDGSISTDKLAANAVTAAKIAANTITASQIAANTITATQIAANTITAGQIAAGTIGATQIAANAITASKVAVVDMTNIWRNPDFAGGSSDGLFLGTSGAIVLATNAGVPASAPTAHVFKRAVPPATVTDLGHNNWIAAAPGETFYFEATVAAEAGTNGTLSFQMRYADATQATNLGIGVGSSLAAASYTTWTRFGATVTVPATVSSLPVAYVRFYIRSNINASPAGAWYVTQVIVRRAANAEMVVDGAITATKISAGAVTTAKLAAGAVTANEIASSAITAVKIDAGAVTTAKIAAGAVTANEIAAATITGGKIAAGTITGSNIAADTITAGQIAAGAISASEVAAGAITVQKLLVAPASICPDPYFADEAWWTSTLLDANGWFFESNTAINAPKQAALWSGATTPPGTTRKHLWSGNVTAPAVGTVLRLRARVNNGSNQAVYVAARFYDSGGANVGSDITLTSNASSGIQDLTGQGTVPAYAATVRFIIYNAAPGAAFSGGVQVSAVMLDVAASADLIVDGAITANKIAANAIAVGTAAIQNGAIVNAMLGDATIQSAKIADAAITTAKIGDAQITNAKIGDAQITNAKINDLDAGKITAGTISADRIGANSITASKINSNGLSIRDNSGNIILAAGSPLDASNITPASGWLNSNISINSDGSLSGAGGGQVSAAGLGVRGLTLINDANCSAFGDTIQKVSGGSAWNAGMRSAEKYAGGAFASITTPSTGVDVMFGLNSNSTTSSYEDIDHAIYLASDTWVRVYEEGTNVGTYGNWSAGEVYTVQYDGTSVMYMRNGSIFYQRALANPNPLFFDCSLYQVGAQLRSVRFGPLTKTKGQNLLDSRAWVVNSSGSQPGFPQNPCSGGVGANYITYDTLPDGSQGIIWRARSGNASGTSPEGGWNSAEFPIDHTKTYRFTVWMRKIDGNSSGSFYLGPGQSQVNDIGGGVNGNPYFVAQGRGAIPNGEWVLVVGYVYQSVYAFSQQNLSGVYRARDGVKILSGTDYRWVSGQATSHHRAYQYYTNAEYNYIDFFDPRVELCDGTEPSIDQLLAMGSVSGRKQITSANASTFIANAAIGTAHIADLNADKINAGTLKVGGYLGSSTYNSTTGWRIYSDGSADFKGVILSRNNVLASGSYTFGAVSFTHQGNNYYEGPWNYLDTGVPISSWTSTNTPLIAAATGTYGTWFALQSVIDSTGGVGVYWGMRAEVLPWTQWSGAATVWIRVRAVTRYIYTTNSSAGFYWALYQVT